MAKTKGYRLIACTGPNAILVREVALSTDAARALPALTTEQAFDRAFVEGRRTLSNVVQSKFITEDRATVGEPGPLLGAYVKVSGFLRKLRRALRGRPPGAKITDARRAHLRKSGLWI